MISVNVMKKCINLLYLNDYKIDLKSLVKIRNLFPKMIPLVLIINRLVVVFY
jgi:hypothetical protein